MKVYQIEISNLCNLTCSYCPHPFQNRPKGLMSRRIFEQTISLVVQCGQNRIYLHNFGEPLMHPELPDFIAYASSQGVTSSFFTNGELLNQKLATNLADAGLKALCVSGHKVGEVERVRSLLAGCGDRIQVIETFRPSNSSNHSWAGQVRSKQQLSDGSTNHTPPDLSECIFEREDAFVVLWDGRIGSCCIAVEPPPDALTVEQVLACREGYTFRAIDLCNHCTLMRSHEEL